MLQRSIPGTGYILNSCGDGTLSIAHEDSPDKYSVVEQVKTVARARTMALDPKTHHVYLSIADFEPPPAAPAGGTKSAAASARGARHLRSSRIW